MNGTRRGRSNAAAAKAGLGRQAASNWEGRHNPRGATAPVPQLKRVVREWG